jgi:hypothetical protein
MPSDNQRTTDSAEVVITRAGEHYPHYGADHNPEEGSHSHGVVEGIHFTNEWSGTTIRDINNPAHVEEDLEHLRLGILDPESFRMGYKPHSHPVEYVVRDRDGNLKQRIHSANLRTNIGGRWQATNMIGPIMTNNAGTAGVTQGAGNQSGGGYPLPSGTISSPSINTVASSTITAPAASQYVNYMIVVGSVWGIITSHTTTTTPTWTVDKWHSFAAAGTSPNFAQDTTATTPTSGATYTIVPSMGPGVYMALTKLATFTTSTPQVGDTASSTAWNSTNEINSNGLARVLSTVSWANANTWDGTNYGDPGLATPTTNLSTFTGSFVLKNTFTCNTSAINAYGSGVFNTSVAQTGALIFEAGLQTAASLGVGDTLAVTWTINY